MKTALCLNGLSSGRSNKTIAGKISKRGEGTTPVDSTNGFNHYDEHILSKNDIDVFIHTWDTGIQDQLKEWYFPIDFMCEKQIIFDENAGKFGTTKQNCYSKWYSTMKSVDLMREHELSNDFTYDMVMIGRFDTAWLTDVIFCEFDQEMFHCSKWRKTTTSSGRLLKREYFHIERKKGTKIVSEDIGWPSEERLMDNWFFSNSRQIYEFSRLFENLDSHSIKKFRNKSNDIKLVRHRSHRQCFQQLKTLGITEKIATVFDMHDDSPLARYIYRGWM